MLSLNALSRPVQGPPTGFGSTINRYEPNHDRRFFNTTNVDAMGSAKKLNPKETV